MTQASSQRVVPVILSGGAGTRLWPLSRLARPKQMLALAGDGSMLRRTAGRVADPSLFAAPVVVAAADQAAAVEQEVPGLAALVLEPCPRNTAPAIALAALGAAPDDVLLVLPSDHLVADDAGFRDCVRRALPFARDGWIVTFGMRPDRPETGYGYIRRGAPLGDGVWAVDRFVEKPAREVAEAWLRSGDYEWNGGIFLMRADTLIDGLARHAPEIHAAAGRAFAGRSVEGRRVRPEAGAFAASPAVSIDYALLEKADRVAVVPAAIGWSDIGSWAALHEVMPHDAAANAVAGEALLIDSAGCLVHSEGPLVAAVGVEDLVIIATPDAVLVVPRRDSQRVREIVDRLRAGGDGGPL